MKRLVQKFRHFFQNFNYIEKSIDNILEGMDIILEMMTIIDTNDVNYAKNLSSFMHLLTSDFCEDILDAKVIEVIYENTICPTLNYLEKKYSGSNRKGTAIMAKELLNTIIPSDVDETELVDIDVEYKNTEFSYVDIINEKKINLENQEIISCNTDSNNTYLDILYIKSQSNELNKDTNKEIFDITKGIGNELYNLYNKILNNTYQNKKIILKDIKYIRDQMKNIKFHPLNPIRSIAITICGICNILISVIESNQLISDSVINAVDTFFKTINNIEYCDT